MDWGRPCFESEVCFEWKQRWQAPTSPIQKCKQLSTDMANGWTNEFIVPRSTQFEHQANEKWHHDGSRDRGSTL